MSGFSAEWLALREEVDAAARSVTVTRRVLDALGRRPGAVCLDLGAGTGSNVRYLSGRITKPQQWRLVDDDAHLLALAAAHCEVPLETRAINLRMLDASLFTDVDLVTASALLDLVSERWLGELVTRCAAGRSAVLFALNYDGRTTWSPSDPDDERVRELVNRHQKTDKGFGPALGPDAASMVRGRLGAAGYEVWCDTSDWIVGPAHVTLQRELIAGCAQAASEIAPSQADTIDRWRGRRLAHVASGSSGVVVGHVDVGGIRP